MKSIKYTKKIDLRELEKKYISTLFGISTEEYDKIQEVFGDIYCMQKHIQVTGKLEEGKQKIVEAYRCAVDIFKEIDPKNEEVEEIKEIALKDINYFGHPSKLICEIIDRVDNIRKEMRGLTVKKIEKYLAKNFIFIGKDYFFGYKKIFYDGSGGFIMFSDRDIEATENVNLEEIIEESFREGAPIHKK